MDKVVVMRKGQAVSIDRSIHERNQRLRRERKALKQKEKLLLSVIEHFDGDAQKAGEWVQTTIIPQYGLSVGELIARGRVVSVSAFIKRTLKG